MTTVIQGGNLFVLDDFQANRARLILLRLIHLFQILLNLLPHLFGLNALMKPNGLERFVAGSSRGNRRLGVQTISLGTLKRDRIRAT